MVVLPESAVIGCEGHPDGDTPHRGKVRLAYPPYELARLCARFAGSRPPYSPSLAIAFPLSSPHEPSSA